MNALVLESVSHTELIPALDPATLLQGLGPATLAVVALMVFIES
jgi:membrane-associated protein